MISLRQKKNYHNENEDQQLSFSNEKCNNLQLNPTKIQQQKN